jgi:hypothetical protein
LKERKLEYHKYEDELRAQNKSMHIDGIWEILFDYSYVDLRLAEGADENHTDKKLVYAGRAFKILNGWAILKFNSTEDNIYQLDDFVSWIDEEEIFEKIQSEVPEYEIPERAIEFMVHVRDAHKHMEPDPIAESEYSFKKNGDVWEVIYEGKKLPLIVDQVGLPYIHLLLKGDLYSPYGLCKALYTISEKMKLLADEKSQAATTEIDKFPGEILDRKSIASLTKRKSELQDIREEADEGGHAEAVEAAEDEIQEIDGQLKLGTYRGKTKGFGNKNSKTISKAIDRAIEAIRKYDIKLAEHFKANISKGERLLYRPPTPINWEL